MDSYSPEPIPFHFSKSKYRQVLIQESALCDEQTLTGVVRDSICKVQNYPNHHKGVTPLTCTLMCVHHEGADYVLVVDDSVYVLDGHLIDLDKFAGGRATVVGHVNGKKIVVDSVTAPKKK